MDAVFSLSFEVPDQHLPRLRRHDHIRRLTIDRPAMKATETVYFDDAGLTRRTRPLGIDKARLDSAGPGGDAALAASLNGLSPIFTRHMTTVTRRLAPIGATLGCVLESSRFSAPGHDLPSHRLILTLEQGSAAPLLELAADLQKSCALAPAAHDPLDSAYRHLADAPPRIVRARPFDLQGDLSRAAGCSLILQNCLEHWLGNHAAVSAGLAEGVHQMRVALRRMRAALSVFREVIPVASGAEVVDGVRWLAKLLGGGREWDVFLSETMPPVEGGFPGDRGLARLRIAADQERRDGYRAIFTGLEEPRYGALIFAVQRLIAELATASAPYGTVEESLQDFAIRTGRQRHAKLLKAGRNFAALSAEARHELRIRIKKIRYMYEFIGVFAPDSRLDRVLIALADLQEGLGVANDIEVATGLVDRLPSGRPELALARGLMLGWHAAEARRGARRLDRAWADFAELKSPWV